jgi:hypothetical protein
MQQSSKGQIPAVDLRMLGGRGFIRGISGIDDRGETFVAAGSHLSRLAESQGEFSWSIDLDIEFGPTTSLLRFLAMIDTLDTIARNRKLRGSIELKWTVPANDLSLMSTAKNAQAEIRKLGEGGLKLILLPKSG